MGRTARLSVAARRKAEERAFEALQQRQRQQTEQQELHPDGYPPKQPAADHAKACEAQIDEISRSPCVTVRVAQADVGTRVDAFLTTHLPSGLTRSRIQRAIRDGGVMLNGYPIDKLSVKLRLGDELEWVRDARREAPGFVQPEKIHLHIYHEDESCIVLEKPAGMTVHPARGLRNGTLVNALLHHTGCGPISETAALDDDSDGDSAAENDTRSTRLKKLNGLSTGSGLDGSASVRPGIVHRLDRGTSGVMVVAKNDAAHAALAAQFAAHTSRRSYLALVWGTPEPAEGVVKGSIGRDPADRLRMTVVPDGKGKPAVTHYSLVEMMDGGHVSLVRFKLETGRTHQVRVHARHIGHPLLGDTTYKGAQLLRGTRLPSRVQTYAQLFKVDGVLSRPALHAETLAFAHPETQDWLSFSSVLPTDISTAIEMIKSSSLPPDSTEVVHGSTIQPVTLVVCRHGNDECKGDKKPSVREWDAPLTEAGFDQIVSMVVPSLPAIDLIISCPSLRCIQTAVAARQALNVSAKVLIDGCLMQAFHPQVVLKSTLDEHPQAPQFVLAEEIESMYPDVCDWETCGDMPSWGETYHDGDSECERRFLGAFERLAQTHQGMSLLLVTHGWGTACAVRLCHRRGHTQTCNSISGGDACKVRTRFGGFVVMKRTTGKWWSEQTYRIDVREGVTDQCFVIAREQV